MNRCLGSAIAAVVVSISASSCASLTVNSLPQPGASHSGGYDIIIEFSNVLNLPERAKVVQDGTAVGVVTRVDLKNNRVDVTSRIDSGVVVPTTVRATLQQSTVLGDTYVALDRGPADEGSLACSH